METSETALSFNEETKDYVTFGETDYDRGYRSGQTAGTFLMFQLTTQVSDVERFLAELAHASLGYARPRGA